MDPADSDNTYKVKYPWIEITLKEPVRIAALEIQGYGYVDRTTNAYSAFQFKNVEIMAGMEPTDLAKDEIPTAMDTKNPVAVIFKGPLRHQTKEYLTFSEPYKTAKYLMIQRNINSHSLMELSEVKVLGETCKMMMMMMMMMMMINTDISPSWSWAELPGTGEEADEPRRFPGDGGYR